VAFVLSTTHSGWTGGINYLSNLLHAVGQVKARQIEPVLVVHPSTPDRTLASFPHVEVLRTRLAEGGSRGWGLARKLSERGLGQDVLMTRFLRHHRIDLMSHSGQLGAAARLPTIGWLPDFQHRRMPEFFEPAELAARDRGYRRIAEQCTTVLLSSVDAQQDLAAFVPDAVGNSRVLHFVSGFAGGAMVLPEEAALRDRYDISGPYFHLPNQFWAHKNHRVVIGALALLKARGQVPLVLCTGQTKDSRQPAYFDELINHARVQGVAEQFRVLGLVPYEDLAGLMRCALAVINPSLFEGWSTTVEESKSLGLTVVLSDIPVHREQAPARGVYFAPRDAASLAGALEKVQEGFADSAEQSHRAAAQARLPASFAAFGEQYQEIVLDTLARS
jgi:hypothetical protein